MITAFGKYEHRLLGEITVATAVQESFLLKCDGSLNLARSAETRQLLLQTLNREPDVLIDTADASEMDITFVQLLISARKSAEAGGRKIYLGAPAGSQAAAILARANVLEHDVPTIKEVPARAAAASEDIDPSALITLINEIGEAAVGQSLSVFFTQMGARIQTMRDFSEDTHAAEIRRELHPLKGAAGTFGLKGVATQVAALERTVGTLGAEGYVAAIDSLMAALRSAQSALRSVLAKANG